MHILRNLKTSKNSPMFFLTAMKIVPSNQWTMEKKETKRVEVAAVDDKQQITAIFACSMSGKFLPMQLIYKGTTKRCLPKDVNFLCDWHITHTENHSANEVTTFAYLRNVIIPYVKREREALKLQDDHCTLALFDIVKGQCTTQVMKILEENNILFVTIALAGSSHWTCRLTNQLKSSYEPSLESGMVVKYGSSLKRERVNKEVDMRMSNMKPLTAQWMMNLHHYLASHPVSSSTHGFKAAGIKNCHYI